MADGIRTVIVKDDELWLMAIIKAKKQGKSLSKVIRDFLTDWLKTVKQRDN